MHKCLIRIVLNIFKQYILLVRVPDYRVSGPGSILRSSCLMITIEELLGRKSSGSSLERREFGCHPKAPAALYSSEDSWYSFLLEVESAPGHNAAGSIISVEMSSDIGNRNRDLLNCIVMPPPSTLLSA
jgi:hypothetical protein